MFRMFSRPLPFVALLAFCTFIPILVAAVTVVQIPTGLVPPDSMRLMVAPVWFFVHTLSGVLFGVLGPLQFARVLNRRFGRLHRITGRVFAVAGIGMGLGGLALLLRVDSVATPILDIFRGLAGAALIGALVMGIRAARRRDLPQHRAWMIRSYAIGMGTGTIALVMFPIYIITGAPLSGWLSDTVFVGWWAINIAIGEWVVQRGGARRTIPA